MEQDLSPGLPCSSSLYEVRPGLLKFFSSLTCFIPFVYMRRKPIIISSLAAIDQFN